MNQENRREHGRTGYQGPRAERQQHKEEIEMYSVDAGDRNQESSHQVDDTSGERRKSRRKYENQQAVRSEQRREASTEVQQTPTAEAMRGTKRWLALWSVLLIGIITALCVISLRPDGGKRVPADTANIGESRPASGEESEHSAGITGETDASAAVSDSDEDATIGNGTTIMIENPTDTDAAESGGTAGAVDADKTESAMAAVRLLFAGDVYLSDHVMEAYDAAGGIDGVVSKGYQAEIQAADYFITNEEFPFSTRGTPAPDKQFTFRVHPEKVKMMQEMGIDLVTLANNHALDYGRDAMLDTIDTLDHAGIRHVGAGKNLAEARKPAIVELNGRTFAFIGATRVYPEADWAAGTDAPGMFSAYDGGVQLAEEVKAAKQQADYVIAYVHWGIEREEMPNEVQKSIAHRLVDAGADLVIGAHPHVLQGLEYYQGVPIAYSLGNFVFGSSIPSTALLQADVDEEGIRLRLIPGTSSAGYTRKLDDAEKIAAFYEKMSGLSTGVKIDADGYVSAA